MKIAIIPARKGSKRLINKNMKILDGIPLIEYTFKFALANNFDKIIVSTDDINIQKLALKYNFEVHKRTSNLSTDNSLILELLISILSHYSISYDDIICLLQPTNPIRESDLFLKSLNIFLNKEYDSLISISELKKKVGVLSGNYFKPNYEHGGRTQELNNLYYENGDIYILKSSNILDNKLFGKKIGYILTGSEIPSIDIDFQHDFDLCELAIKKFKNKFDYL